jgi:polyhydroxybutyrate depolymerase
MRVGRPVVAVAAMLACGSVFASSCSRPRAVKPAGPATNPLVAARPYRLAAPAALDPRRRYPLLIVLHGLGGRSENIERYYQLDTLVDELGFLAAYPDGTEETRKRYPWGRYRRFWNATDACCDFWRSGVDDVALLDAVIDDVSARYHVDARRVFVLGLSNGGYMAYRYACDRAARVAAIVSQAGAMWMDASHCKPSEPVAVLQIHGTEDELVPYDPRASGGPGATPSAHQSVADWVAFDGCRPGADTSSPALDLVLNEGSSGFPDAETTIEKWSGCRGVELWTMRGAKHVPHLSEPFWARTVYAWLVAHPKP